MSVGVFIVSHNHARTLPAVLGALLKQAAVAKVVVVDNASRDGSAEVVRGFSRQLPLQLVAAQENLGFSRAANLALGELSTPWVLSLNPDCRLSPGFLDGLLGVAEQHDRLGSATGLLLRGHGPDLIESPIVDSAGMIVTASGRHFDRGAGKPLRRAYLRPRWVFGATGACALYRTEALGEVAYPGGEVFDEAFFAYREDADLAWRLQRQGWRCLYWPHVRAVHGRGLKPELGRCPNPAINVHSVKNRFLLRAANADWRWHAGCFPFWLFRDLMVFAGCLLWEKSSLAAFPLLSQAWPAQLRKRQLNNFRARVSSWKLLPWFFPLGRTRKYEPCA